MCWAVGVEFLQYLVQYLQCTVRYTPGYALPYCKNFSKSFSVQQSALEQEHGSPDDDRHGDRLFRRGDEQHGGDTFQITVSQSMSLVSDRQERPEARVDEVCHRAEATQHDHT